MKTCKKLLLFLFIATALTSCGGTTHYLSSGQFSKDSTYNVNGYDGCCGCSAKYFIINSGKRKVEQIIYSYNCYNIGSPTKFIFNYNKHGRLTSCNKYVATTANDFTIEINEYEKKLFSVLDTSASMRANHFVIKFSAIRGFRKAYDNEITHAFPLIKKGVKLPIY